MKSMLIHGVLNHYDAHNGNVSRDISDYDVQRWRERRVDGNTAMTTSSEAVCKSAFLEMIRGLISAYFPNGFRIDSPIELSRFRRFADKDFGDEISIPDDELMKFIADCGTFFDGKVYVISNDITSKIQHNVELAIIGSRENIYKRAKRRKKK